MNDRRAYDGRRGAKALPACAVLVLAWIALIAPVPTHGAASDEAPAVAADTLPPTVPGRPTAAFRRPNSVVLTWPGSVDDSGRVWYEVVDDGVVLVTTPNTTWTQTYAERRDHRFVIRAVDDAGNRSIDSPELRFDLEDIVAPTTPDKVVVSAISPTQLAVQWSGSADDVGVDHYEVIVDEQDVVNSDSTSAVTVPLTEWEVHCIVVRAVDRAGNRSDPTTRVCSRTLDAGAWKARYEQVVQASANQR